VPASAAFTISPPQAANRAQALLDEPRHCDDAPPADATTPDRPWTLGEAVAASICRALGVRQGAAGVLQADAAQLLASGRWQPALSLNAGWDSQRDYGTSTTALLRLDWVLFDFGQRSAASRQAGQALAAALDEQRSEVLNAVAQTALLFTTAQAAQGRYEAAAANLVTAMEGRQLAEARRDAGAASLAERSRADTVVAQARVEHARAQAQWLSARGALALALGRHAKDALELADAPPADEAANDIDLPALLDEARQRHPRIRAARARLTEAQARLDGVQNERWGSVGMSLQGGRSRFSSDLAFHNQATAALGWTLPLFDRAVNASRQRDAAVQLRARDALLDEALLQVEGQVWEQGQTLQGERAARRDSQLALEHARAALRITSERYRLGVGSFSDLLAAQSAEARARLRLAAAVGRLGPLAPQ
jgi:outer membrane protein